MNIILIKRTSICHVNIKVNPLINKFRLTYPVRDVKIIMQKTVSLQQIWDFGDARRIDLESQYPWLNKENKTIRFIEWYSIWT